MEADDDRADQAIIEAISEAVQAGVFRRAERLDPGVADVWDALAAPHSRRAATLLTSAINRLCVEDAGPDARGEEW